MKLPSAFLIRTILCCLACLPIPALRAQPLDCTFKPPVVRLDFGRGQVSDINDAHPPNYSLVWNTCPDDGYYTFTSATSDCFYGDWFTLKEDHSPEEAGGNMMLVNASPKGGMFFHRVLEGLKGGTTYKFMAWMMNVCRIRGGCPPLPPNIMIRLTTPSGKVPLQFRTGPLVQTASPQWTSYQHLFTLPPGESTVVLTMVNTTTGGCGNDFALDDITISECIKPESLLASLAKRAGQAINRQVVLRKPATKSGMTKEQAKEPPQKPANRTTQVAQLEEDARLPVIQTTKPKPISTHIPSVLLTRENALVKQIETGAGEIRIDLYDNGVVDGDTVSVYHNNQLIISEALLSQRPITFRILVDAQQSHHDLIMVAHNLGSIPPNTSLMVVTAGGQRHEAFLSSSKQMNARVIIRLKE